MCINQKTIVNRRYIKAVKNFPGNMDLSPSKLSSLAEVVFRHAQDLYILVDCGRCLQCQKKRSTMWRNRLIDEFKYLVERDPDKKHRVFFVTLTLAPKYYKNDVSHVHSLITKFRERYRKRFGKSLRCWITTEYGEKRGRLHLHAIFFDPLFEATQLPDLWQYGRCDMSVVGCSPKNPEQDPVKGIVYVTKYITKFCDQNYIDWNKRSHIFSSPGLGLRYCLDSRSREFHNQKGGLFFRTDPSYKYPLTLPRYYVNKIFSPVDIFRHSLIALKRMSDVPVYPLRVGPVLVGNFNSHVSILNSLGGRVNLLSTQFDKLTLDEKRLYLSQPKISLHE